MNSRYLAAVGSQNSQAQFKWLSHYYLTFGVKTKTRDSYLQYDER